jgi:DNA mismatch repair protein MSH3
VHACREAVVAAEAHLQALLPKLAATAGVRSCSYVTIQNQGTYLVELPADFARVPAGWEKVGGVVQSMTGLMLQVLCLV